jgi:hypothetical protein
MQYYKKLNFPEFLDIQNELKEFVHNTIQIQDSSVEYTHECNYEQFLSLKKFVLSHIKVPIQKTKIYLTPPGRKWDIHIDGTRECANRIGLNFPIYNYTETFNYWWNNNIISKEEETIIHTKYGPIALFYDRNKYLPSDYTCIDDLTIFRTDHFHTVENKGNSTRINLIIKFDHSDQDYDFKDFINYE